jgi:hypothetical protein
VRCWCGARAVRFSEDDPLVCLGSAAHNPGATGESASVKRLYVAGPMTGYPDCNYPEFNRVSGLLRAVGFEAVNPAENTLHGHYVDFLREDLRQLLDCDGVATLDNWWLSVGARNEVSVAGLLRLPVRTVAEWLSLGPQG